MQETNYYKTVNHKSNSHILHKLRLLICLIASIRDRKRRERDVLSIYMKNTVFKSLKNSIN